MEQPAFSFELTITDQVESFALPQVIIYQVRGAALTAERARIHAMKFRDLMTGTSQRGTLRALAFGPPRRTAT